MSVEQKKELLKLFGPTLSKGVVLDLTHVAKVCGQKNELAGAVPKEAHEYLKSKKIVMPSQKKVASWTSSGGRKINSWETETTSSGGRQIFTNYET